LEEGCRSLTRNLELREGALVEERCRLATGPGLGPARGRPQHPRPAARAERLVSGRGIRLEPVGALPARLLAEDGAELPQAPVRGRHAERPSSLALVARVL